MKNDFSHRGGSDFLRPACWGLFGSLPESEHYRHSGYNFQNFSEMKQILAVSPSQVLYRVFL